MFGDNLTGNQGLIQNIQSIYWSATQFAPNPSNAWFFSFGSGSQLTLNKNFTLFGWAVRPGDVLDAPVPEPSTWLLLGAGLAGLGFSRARARPRRG